jgi:rhamnosyltransferase
VKIIPKLAILLAAHNGVEFIKRQIESILMQKNVDFLIFVSIDRSTDDTESYLANWALSESRLRLLSFGQRFGCAGSNFFHLILDTDFSKFDYIAFSDQDDIWDENKISRAIDLLVTNNYSGYSSNVTAFWPDGKSRLINKSQPQVEWDYLFESAGPGCTFVLTQSLALALQAFIRNHPGEMQSVWLHDWFTYAFARANGYRWTIDSQSTMQYRQHVHNQVGVNLGFKAFKHRVAFILSRKWFEQAALIANLVGKSESDFVKTWLPFSRVGFVKLAFHANKCRRKYSEQVWFFCICLLLAITGINTDAKTHKNRNFD